MKFAGVRQPVVSFGDSGSGGKGRALTPLNQRPLVPAVVSTSSIIRRHTAGRYGGAVFTLQRGCCSWLSSWLQSETLPAGRSAAAAGPAPMAPAVRARAAAARMAGSGRGTGAPIMPVARRPLKRTRCARAAGGGASP